MTELQQFKAMLERAWIGHGLRHDSGGTTVLVESGENEIEFMITEFFFDVEGKLEKVQCYPGE